MAEDLGDNASRMNDEEKVETEVLTLLDLKKRREAPGALVGSSDLASDALRCEALTPDVNLRCAIIPVDSKSVKTAPVMLRHRVDEFLKNKLRDYCPLAVLREN
ncbi:hypothetical protein RR48_06549 [Papilio machaon]|uniref:Uncharacterized protein n=1 Tax=Papilio machaon TaxID=76193 RepID=A0A194RIU2_PAPMA|nr:hypothetical protein RR48_06549 [Papilio machaon]